MIIPFEQACRMAAEQGRRNQVLRRLAEQQVLAKFPKIIIGSTGWGRAVENRYRRLK